MTKTMKACLRWLDNPAGKMPGNRRTVRALIAQGLAVHIPDQRRWGITETGRRAIA